MTAVALLAGFGILLGTWGGWLLKRATWPRRSPMLGIFAWQALSASILMALILMGVVMALPALPVTTDLAAWLDACAMAVRSQYATPGGALSASVGVLVAGGFLSRVAACVALEWSAGARTRRRLREQLHVLAAPGAAPGVLVVEHPTAAVYCLPGGRGRVVATRGALDALDDEQLAAVIAHEQSHLRGRHDLILIAAAAMRRALGVIPALRWAEVEVAHLVEMRADDQALARSSRRTLATALVCLAGGLHPVGSLAAGGAVVDRVRRLADGQARLGPGRGAAIAVGCVVALAVPLVVAAGPALIAGAVDYCPIVFPA